jgi:hypothetical protein
MVVKGQFDPLARSQRFQAGTLHGLGDGPGDLLVINEESHAELRKDFVRR